MTDKTQRENMMPHNVQRTPVGRIPALPGNIAELIMCAAVVGFKEIDPDLRRTMSQICHDQLPSFLTFWTEGCCSATAMHSVFCAALEHEVMAGLALRGESKAAIVVANWSWNVDAHLHIPLDALLDPIAQGVPSEAFLEDFLSQVDVLCQTTRVRGCTSLKSTRSLMRMCMISNILMTHFPLMVASYLDAPFASSEGTLSLLAGECECCMEDGPSHQVQTRLISILKACLSDHVDVETKQQAVNLAGLVMIHVKHAFSATKTAILETACNANAHPSIRALALQGYVDGFTAHCSQLCRRSWEQFVQVIDHLSGCTQPENLQIASLIGVGRILLHEVQASTTHCLTDKLLLILVTKYALSKQGSRIFEVLSVFLEEFIPTAYPSHLSGAIALLLADALKAGLLRFVMHEEKIIEDSLRKHDLAALLSSFEMLAPSIIGAGFDRVAESVVELVADEMPWLQIEHIQEWCRMRSERSRRGTVKGSEVAAQTSYA